MNTGTFATYFSCTNADAASVTVGVVVFGPAGGSPLNTFATTALSLAPGATTLFGTNTSNWVTVDANLAPSTVSKGSARILATSKKIICTAFLADPVGNPSFVITSLTIVAKTKQRGD